MLPKSAKAKWIALIPSLDFKLIAYETDRKFFVEVSLAKCALGYYTEILEVSEGYLHKNQNSLVKKAFELAELSSDYAEQFNRAPPYEFVRNMLSNACFNKDITHKDCYIFETL